VLKGLNLPSSLETYLNEALSNLFMLIWQSGIQIILFIAGLQSIPDLLYEVAKVEGATKWEEFWFITLPMLLRTLLLVIFFTIVEVVTSANNVLVQQGYNQYNNLKYGSGSAMMWFYFVIVGAIIGLFLLLYNKFLKKWG
jgi:ABC-type sugar transport system permease subunit